MNSTNKNLDYDSLFKEIDRYNELPVSNESFSEYLTRIKYHNQISNKKLADRTGLSEATVCRYLTGSAKRMTNANILALVMGFELTSTQIEAETISRVLGGTEFEESDSSEFADK